MVTCGIPSQSSACCMASRALSTGLDWSHWSQSGHRPASNTGRELESQPSDTFSRSSQSDQQKVQTLHRLAPPTQPSCHTRMSGWGHLMLILTPPSKPWQLTWCTAVHQRSQGLARLPVSVEVGDWQFWQLVLDPSQQPLLWSLLLAVVCLLLLVPHGHGDRVMQN